MQENRVQIVVEVDAKTGRATIRQLGEEMAAAGSKGRDGFGQAASGADRLAAGMRPVVGLAQQLGLAFGAYEIVQFGRHAVQTADDMRLLDQRLLLSARNVGDYVRAQQSVVDISLDAHQPLATTGTLYNRLAIATKNLDTSQQDLADVTKAVALSVALSGSSAQESAAGMLQFAQAMGSGRLQGDELRSVLENMPVLAMLLVDAVGGSMAEFRRQAEAGLLTTEWMVEVLTQALPQIEAQAEAMPLTIDKALTDMRTKASLYIDEVNRSTGVTAGLATSVMWLGDNMEGVAQGGVMILTAGLSLLAGRGIASVLTAMPRMISAIRDAVTVTETATVVTTAYSVATQTTTRVSLAAAAAKLLTMPNIIGAVTTVLSLGATAWMIWGDKADEAASRAARRLEEAKRYNQMLKEIDDPGLRLREIAAERAGVQADLDRAVRRAAVYDTSDGGAAALRARLRGLDEEYRLVQENMAMAAKQRAGEEMAAGLAIDQFEKQMAAERQRASAVGLEKSLIDIRQRKSEALAAAAGQFKAKDDYARAEAAIIARYAAEETRAREDAGKAAAGIARRTAEAARSAMAEYGKKTNILGLDGLARELAEISREAADLREKFGDQIWITTWQDAASAAAEAADQTRKHKDEVTRLKQTATAYRAAELAAMPEHERAVAQLADQYDTHRAAVVAWGEAQIAAGNDAAEVMGRVFFALDQLDLRQKLDGIEKTTRGYNEAVEAGMTAQARDLAALSRQYDTHRAAVVAWGEAQIAAGNDAAEVMGRVFFALDQLDLRQAEATEDLKHRAGELTEFQKQAFRNMESAAGTFFFDAMQGNFDNMLDGFLSMTQRMVAEWTAAQAMMGLFGDEFGRGGSLGGLLGTAASALGGWLGGGSAGGVTAASTSGDSLTSIAYDSGWLSRPSYSFGGHRAGGGAVSSGKMYEVTEGGIPELLFTGGKQYLMMGQNSGMVIPATAAPAGGGSSSSVQPQAPAPIYVTIIAADAQSITDMMRRNPQAVLGPLRDALQKGDRGLRGDLQRVLQ